MIENRLKALPDVPVPFLPRPRLLSRLGEGLSSGKRLALVTAGPGAGKTTLVVDFLRSAGCTTVWFPLTFRHQEPAIFLRDLLVRLRDCLEVTLRETEVALASLGTLNVAQAIGLLCDELEGATDRSFILAIDDLEHLAESAIPALESLVRDFPAQAQLILCGRRRPGIKLSQYQLKGEVIELGDRDLRFSVPEITELFDATGQASPETVSAIAQRTHGWATGVVFALCAGRTASGWGLDHPGVLYEFLAEEVLGTLSEPFKNQLFECSFLPRLDPALCRNLLDQVGDEFLDGLKRHPTFITFLGGVAEFVPLFKEFLQAEALKRWSNERQAAHFRRLAALEHRREAEIALWQRAGDWDQAEAVLRANVRDFLHGDHAETIRPLLAGFPPQFGRSSCWIQYFEGELARTKGDLTGAIVFLLEAERLAQESRDDPARARIAISLASAYAASGDLERGEVHALRALDLLSATSPEPLAACLNVLGNVYLQGRRLTQAEDYYARALDLYRASADPQGQVRVLHNLGLAASRRGAFDRAIRYYEEAINQAQATGRHPLPLTYNNLAVSALHLDRLEIARNALEQGMALAERLGDRRDRCFLLWTLGQLCLKESQDIRALDAFEASLTEARTIGDRISQVNGYVGLAEAALYRGDVFGAQDAVSRSQALWGAPLLDPQLQDAALIQVEIDIRQGNGPAARRLLESLTEQAKDPSPHRDFHLAQLWSWCLMVDNDAASSRSHLERARAIAEEFGYPFPSLGPLATNPPAPAISPAPDRGGPSLSISCLGSFDVIVDGRRIEPSEWRSSSARLILVICLLDPRGATKEELESRLYGTGQPTRAAIPMAVNRLRHALEPGINAGASRFILFRDGRYVFNECIDVRCDAIEFRKACKRARSASPADSQAWLEAAVALYQGPFLAEFSSVSWCQMEAEQLRRLLRETYEQLFARAGAADQWERLEQLAGEHLRLDPCALPAYKAQMVALAMLEHPEDALKVRNIASNAFERTLGIHPDEDLQTLAELIGTGRLTVKAARSFLPDL